MRHTASLCLALIAVRIIPAAAQSTAPDTVTVSGFIINQFGLPIAGATVILTSQTGKEVDTARTNSRGEYSMLVHDGWAKYWQDFTAVGHAPHLHEDVGSPRASLAMVNHGRGASGPRRVHCVLRELPALEASRDVLPGSTRVDRAVLGPSDAITVGMRRGTITVVGVAASIISYKVERHMTFPDTAAAGGFKISRPVGGVASSYNPVPGSQDELDLLKWGLLEAQTHPVPPDGFHTTFGPNGMDIEVSGDKPQDIGLELTLFVPRNLKMLKLNVDTMGAVAVDNFDGELSIQSASGSVALNQITGPTVVEARDGGIRATVAHLPASGAGGLDFLARNGDVIVTLPADARFDYDLEAHGNGHLSSDFPLDGRATPPPVEHTSDLERLKQLAPGIIFTAGGNTSTFVPITRTGHVNGGGTLIKLAALSGSVIITRGPP